MRYEVAVRAIALSGRWEEWVVSVDADNKTAALAKVLRRKRFSERLLEDPVHRFRFRVDDSAA